MADERKGNDAKSNLPANPKEIFSSVDSLKSWWSSCDTKPPKLISRALHCLRIWREWDTMESFLQDLSIDVYDPSTWHNITSTEMGILCIALLCEEDIDIAMVLVTSLASRNIVRKRSISLIVSHLVSLGRIEEAVSYFIILFLPRFEPNALDLKPFGNVETERKDWVRLLEAIHASGHPIDLLTLPLGDGWDVKKGESLGLSLKPMDPEPMIHSLTSHIREEFGRNGEQKLMDTMKVASDIDFTIVVDGANVLFSQDGKFNCFSFAGLNSLLVNLKMRGHKPLIVLHERHLRHKGRPTPGFSSFMKTWNDRVVSTPFGMNDDHFAILICLQAMRTNPSIFFLTKDLLRDHIAHWDSRMRRWHTEHAVTYTIEGHPTLGYKVNFKFPCTFSRDLYVMHGVDGSKTYALPLQMPPFPPSPVTATRHSTVYFGVLTHKC